MTKYLFLYRNPPMEGEHPSPEEMQKQLTYWSEWKEKFKAHVAEMGDGLKPTGRLLAEGKVTDGPFAESKELIGGYSIVSAESYEQALEVARECPITAMPGASIEIREMMGF